ncbi:MAG TPA: SDR family NAD(P)-dependent oxidoreductase, partial [Polyangiaceae bacterium]
MDLELAGKVAVVTGASKGIGLSIVRELQKEGAIVVAGARSTKSLEGMTGVSAVAIDLSTAEGPQKLVERAVELHGKVD